MTLNMLKLTCGIFSMAMLTLLFSACQDFATDVSPKNNGPVFEMLRKDATGLDFENVLKQSLEFNALNYAYYFNGGGLAAGDFNNDGLVDLYFTSNMGPNKLFLNEGGMKFRDVTEQAGVAGMEGAWTTGATLADVNSDGLLDIYVSQVGDYQILKGQNQLFICKGIRDGVPFFEDEAILYGLDLIGFGTQAAFFDYDLDGDLDFFQLNHSLHSNNTFGQRKEFEGTQHPTAGDRLFRNDGQTTGKPTFTEVTMAAGIKSTVIGYGLGLVIGDVNLDGWPDIFVGNDFHENDYLYLNQRDGTFKEVLTEQMMHTSNFSMGCDMADINNDGWSEIISLDMLPEDPIILKSSQGDLDYGTYQFRLNYGYHPQYARNNLQLNNGDNTFSEIGLFAGIFATDWSWSALFLDFDHDGYKDLFVGNGIPRRMNDLDYINYRKSDENFQFRTNNSYMLEENLEVIDRMPRIKLPNKFYRNTGQLTFEDLEKQIAGAAPTYSSGAIYADLDNDGDLDIVVNNIEDEPFVYRNLTMENGSQAGSYLALKLQGTPGNPLAIGAKAVVFKRDEKLVAEHFPVRGFQSCSPTGLHLGVGDTAAVDSVVVIWPDGTFQRLGSPGFNRTVPVAWKAGLPRFNYEKLRTKKPYLTEFEAVADQAGLHFTHEENPFIEFHRERLMPYMVSSEGPALAVGDVNGDGLEDVFFGSAKRRKNALYLQTPTGRFLEKTPASILADSLFEDVDAEFVDLDNDGDLDLVIAAGGNEYSGTQEAMQQRAYLNDGAGNFQRMDFEGVFMTASCILPTDFDQDGLVDLFFGARAVPWNYGITPKSVLLRNLGNGRFEDVTEKTGGGMHDVGLVKNGAWCDLDGDGDQDLVLAVEWEPITVFLNTNGIFQKQKLAEHTGWWNFVLAHDFDGDGDVDLLAGNFGKNSKLKPTPEQPLRLYVNDFDDNEQRESVMTYYLGGREIPFANYEEMMEQMPGLKKKFLFAKDFAHASLTDLFPKEKLASAVVREANTLQSMYFENTGNMQFKARALPDELQFSTLNAACLADLDGDGREEVLLGGNFFECNIQMGRYDASYGHVLRIGSGGEMQAFPLGGVSVKGQVRRIAQVEANGQPVFIFTKNDNAAQVLRPVPKGAELTGQ